MNGNIKFALASIALVAICLGTWFFFSFSKIPRKQSMSTLENQSNITPTPTIQQSPSTPPESKEEVLRRCIVEEKAKASGIQYEAGSLLVSFKEDVSLETAKKVILANALSFENKEQSNFEINRWLTVHVSSGDEFKWICTLRDDTNVRNAILNRIFTLHE